MRLLGEATECGLDLEDDSLLLSFKSLLVRSLVSQTIIGLRPAVFPPALLDAGGAAPVGMGVTAVEEATAAAAAAAASD